MSQLAVHLVHFVSRMIYVHINRLMERERLNAAGIISACGNMKFEEFYWMCRFVSPLGTIAVC